MTLNLGRYIQYQTKNQYIELKDIFFKYFSMIHIMIQIFLILKAYKIYFLANSIF